MRSCTNCDKEYQTVDTAPYMRDISGELTYACRKCINEWITLGILWASIPFWMRREGKDQ